MSLLGYTLLLTAALCCTAAPASDDSCPRPNRLEGAELQGEWDEDSYPQNTEANYQCRPGYRRQGSLKLICLKGAWQSLNKGQCTKKPCGHPGDIQSGSFELIKEESFIFGAVVEYHCDEGYQMISREKTRQCTASGWSNYLPSCEVRNCPPINAADNINVVSTSYDEEYSVGQVIKFECKDPSLKLNGASVIFCTAEGHWNMETPTCMAISCIPPQINNGRVNNPKKSVYKSNEVIQITCNEGFFTDKNGESTCTKDDWIPKPACNEIVCSPYVFVENGKIISTQTVYKYGEEIDVECNRGHTLQIEPTKRRKCTSNGWSPPIRCVSKKCDRPEIKHGYSDDYYYFPLDTGRSMYYYCSSNFLTPEKKYYASIKCTEAGWNPEPRCLRKCVPPPDSWENGWLKNRQSIYLEGEKGQFQCYENYKTPDGNSYGEITCLPNGKFTLGKCSIKCKAPQLQNGKLNPIKNEFEIGEYLQYECNKGYTTRDKKLFGRTQCVNGEWSEFPSCVVITCTYKNAVYKDGDIVKYTCSDGTRPTSDIGQCYYFGLGPQPSCQDIECTIPDASDLILRPRQKSYKVKSVVSFLCRNGFSRVGSPESSCTEEGWNPPLPKCKDENAPTENPFIEEPTKPGITDDNEKPEEPTKPGITDDNEKPEKKQRCPPAYTPTNAEIIDPKEAYYSNDTITVKCFIGYKMYGSSIVQCIERKWSQPPECIRSIRCKDPPTIKNGNIVESSKQEIYITDDVVKYFCKSGFHISWSDQSTCLNGQWTTTPKCTEDSCDEAPEVTNANVIEKKKTFNHGEKANYFCKDGFRFSGKNSANCVEGKWWNIPTCVTTSCEPPPTVPNAVINGKSKATYASGEKVTYSCNRGYSLEKSLTGEALCQNTQWFDVPECRKIGEQCGPPPTVQFGDTLEIRKANYKSGEVVVYKCPNYYILKGEERVQCLNGVWDEAPVCIEPCTAKEKNMGENNIQLKWKDEKKLYSKHGEWIEFSCTHGHEAPPGTEMRITCQQGKLQYPKCFKTGFCVLQQAIMIANNINYNKSNVVDPGQTITFQCNEGMMAENKLEATCERGNINYPKCISAKSCATPEILNGLLKTEQQDSYNSGSSVAFECNKNYVINGAINSKCENGQWINLPVCLRPCKISSEDLNKSNIQLLSSDEKNIYKHGTELSVSCKSGFRRQNQANLAMECYDGKFRYPRCFSGNTCRIDQEGLDQNNLELDEVHDNEVFYTEGEIIQFKCKNGFYHLDQPTATCSDQKLSYPTCAESSSV